MFALCKIKWSINTSVPLFSPFSFSISQGRSLQNSVCHAGDMEMLPRACLPRGVCLDK